MEESSILGHSFKISIQSCWIDGSELKEKQNVMATGKCDSHHIMTTRGRHEHAWLVGCFWGS